MRQRVTWRDGWFAVDVADCLSRMKGIAALYRWDPQPAVRRGNVLYAEVGFGRAFFVNPVNDALMNQQVFHCCMPVAGGFQIYTSRESSVGHLDDQRSLPAHPARLCEQLPRRSFRTCHTPERQYRYRSEQRRRRLKHAD